MARIPKEDRDSIGDILDLTIAGPDGALILLSAVADIAENRFYSRIHRINGVRTVTVTGSIDPDIANARELLDLMKKDFLPRLETEWPGVRSSIAGESRETGKTGASLRTSLIVGLLGIYMILACQFKSYVQPAAVLAAIPFGIAGVFWGHWALGLQLSVPSLLGLVTLFGVIINDSILLVTFIKEKTARGIEIIDAAIQAVRDRFRAVFLTSLTTIAGLSPLLFEPSTQAQFLRPLMASLAFGLSGATILALFITPSVFVMLHDAGWINPQKKQ